MEDEPLLTIELSEHDASRLLLFARKQAASGDAWGAYWQRVVEALKRGIERLSRERQVERRNGLQRIP